MAKTRRSGRIRNLGKNREGVDRWELTVFLGRDAEGKRVYRYYSFVGEKKAAEAELHTRLDEVRTGRHSEKHRKSLAGYLLEWVEIARTRVRARTHEDYVGIIHRYLLDCDLSHKRLETITPMQIQQFYASLQHAGGKGRRYKRKGVESAAKAPKALSARTVRYVHTILNQAFKMAVRLRLITHNPAADVDLPRQQRTEMQALGPDQAHQFLAAAAQTRFAVLWSFVLATGLRFGEFAGLKWEDVDWHGGQVYVRRALARAKTKRKEGEEGPRWRLYEPKTAKSRRAVAVPSSVMQQLRAHRTRQLEERLAAGETWSDHNFVFTSPFGEPLNNGTLIIRHFKPLLKAAGLPLTLRIHDLRHSCATLLLAAGENPKIVSERLGHSSITLTMDTYSHVLPNMQRSAADKLESMLFGNGLRG